MRAQPHSPDLSAACKHGWSFVIAWISPQGLILTSSKIQKSTIIPFYCFLLMKEEEGRGGEVEEEAGGGGEMFCIFYSGS